MKISEVLWQCYRNKPANNTTDSKTFIFKFGITDTTDDTGTVNVKIVPPLEYLNNFWSTFGM